jgi:hypothetical protein
VRHALLRIGERVPQRAFPDLRVMLGYLELGAWLGTPVAHETREQLFGAAAALVEAERPVYLEFGVYRGDSLRWWSEHLRQPEARLFGFDSFEGLPTDWRPGLDAGTFKVDAPPQIDDGRVSLVVGLFEDTLPDFVLPAHDQLIINIDCDLYASTDTVLRWAEPHLAAGTLIYFDELPDRDHELRALREHLQRSGREVEPLGIAGGGLHWLLRYRA